MVTRTKKSSDSAAAPDSADRSSGATANPAGAGAQMAGSVKESAQQIWLAGLGAFARAQDEGGKVFEALVKEGLGIQRKTQAVAEEKISEATSKMASMASDISSKATGQWGKLEGIFEERVSKALRKLGVPTAEDIAALNARIDALSSQASARAAGAPRKTPARKAAARKATAKDAAAPAAKTARPPAGKRAPRKAG